MLKWIGNMLQKGTETILWPSPFKRWFILWNLLKKKIYKGKAVTNLTTWYSLCTFVGNIWFVVISDVLNSRILLVDARGIFLSRYFSFEKFPIFERNSISLFWTYYKLRFSFRCKDSTFWHTYQCFCNIIFAV